MNEGIDDNNLTIGDFKSQVGQMVSAVSHFNSFERSEAFGYLQNCVKKLESFQEDDLGMNKDENEVNENNSDGKDLSEISASELECSNYDSSSTSCKEDRVYKTRDDSKTNCFICGVKYSSFKKLYYHGVNDHPGNRITCRNCNKTFCNSQIYQIHLRLENCCKQSLNKDDVNHLLCPYCDKKYRNFQHYSLHVEGHKRNKCNECGVHFNSRKVLEEHTMNTHNKQLQKDLFECKFCDRKYAQKRSLLKHYRLTHEDKIICLTCGKVFVKDYELKSHEKTHVNKTFSCDTCGEKFSRRQQYLIHMKDHDKYQCLTCKTSCPNKMKLEKHERAGHVIKGLPMEHHCSICGSSFHFQTSLFFHKKMHSLSGKEDCRCVPCKRVFKNYPALRSHVLSEQHVSSVNSSEIPNLLSCKYCNKIFSEKRGLSRHINKYHRQIKKIFQCDICDYKSHMETCFFKHQKLHTKKKEFICEKCGDSFYTKDALIGHFNYVHSDERNFSCEKCGQTFKSASVLNRHMLCHIKERRYKCHCGQSYKFSGNLNRHQSKIHGKKTKLKRVKRLVTDEVANLTSKSIKSKKKKELKEKLPVNSTRAIYALIDTQSAVSLPLEQIITQSNLLLSSNQADSHILQAACHQLNISAENRELVLPQTLEISTLHEVDNLLSEDSLKTTDTNETVDSSTASIFVQELSDTNGSAFLDGESLIHPHIEPSLVTILDDSVDQTDQSNSQAHISVLAAESYYNIHFLDM